MSEYNKFFVVGDFDSEMSEKVINKFCSIYNAWFSQQSHMF